MDCAVFSTANESTTDCLSATTTATAWWFGPSPHGFNMSQGPKNPRHEFWSHVPSHEWRAVLSGSLLGVWQHSRLSKEDHESSEPSGRTHAMRVYAHLVNICKCAFAEVIADCCYSFERMAGYLQAEDRDFSDHLQAMPPTVLHRNTCMATDFPSLAVNYWQLQLA